eukprot:2008741-Rhodomonas_salina.1
MKRADLLGFALLSSPACSSKRMTCKVRAANGLHEGGLGLRLQQTIPTANSSSLICVGEGSPTKGQFVTSLVLTKSAR